MYYLVYQTTNIINQKIYVGAHITSNINDGYLGSGKILQRSIQKYGIENFTKEILHVFDNADDMFLKEREIVNEEFVRRDDTYNIKLGGLGGWDYVNAAGLNWSPEKNLRISGFANASPEERAAWTPKMIENRRITQEQINNGERPDTHPNRKTFSGKYHKDDTKRKMSEAHKQNQDQVGHKNSQYGTCWITNGKTNLKIAKDSLAVYTDKGYRKGRVIARKTESGQDGNAADC